MTTKPAAHMKDSNDGKGDKAMKANEEVYWESLNGHRSTHGCRGTDCQTSKELRAIWAILYECNEN